MKIFQSREAVTALELFAKTEDLVFAVNATGIVRGSCNPAALNALQRYKTILPRGGVDVLRRSINHGMQTIHDFLGNEPAVWKATKVESTDQVLVVCSTELGRLHLSATTDALTGLANKREFLVDIKQERAAKGLTALMLIDVDRFKRLNDTYGHDEGDLVLVAVGRVIAKCTRSEDRAYRYGGEELAVRMSLIDNIEFSRAVARSRAEAIRAGVEQLKFDGIDRPVTVSIGIALYPSNENAASRVPEADRALYYAKENGRNRVVFYDEVPANWTQTGAV